MSNYTFNAQSEFTLSQLESRLVKDGASTHFLIKDSPGGQGTEIALPAAFLVEDGKLKAGTVTFNSGTTQTTLPPEEPSTNIAFFRQGGGLGISDIRVGMRNHHFWDLTAIPIKVEVIEIQGGHAIQITWPSGATASQYQTGAYY